MELRDGNCNQSWASRSESSSQVRSRLVFDMIMISSDKVFYQEFVLDEVAFAVFLCSFAQWTIKRCQLPWTWAALPCQKVLLVWMVENCQSIDSNTCFLVLVLTPNIEFSDFEVCRRRLRWRELGAKSSSSSGQSLSSGSEARSHSRCWTVSRWWKGQLHLWGGNMSRQLLIGRTLEDLQAWNK